MQTRAAPGSSALLCNCYAEGTEAAEHVWLHDLTLKHLWHAMCNSIAKGCMPRNIGYKVLCISNTAMLIVLLQ